MDILKLGFEQIGAMWENIVTPTAIRLQQRLNDRHAWFQNEWFLKWHHIGMGGAVDIDLFNGQQAHYSGLKFSGSARVIYWQAIVLGVRKEIVEQLGWVEQSVRGYDRSVAIQAIDQCAGLLTSFARGIRREAVVKDRILRGDGFKFPVEQDLGRWDGTSDQEINNQADALKAALFPLSSTEQPNSQSATSANGSGRKPHPFQVALSFAGEQRIYVDQVAKALAAKHIAVFYDKFQANELWGQDGAEYFHQIYSQDAQFVVMFISAEYVEKVWTRHERRSAIERQMKVKEEYILPVRFDNTLVPGLPDTLLYLDAIRVSPAELAVEIAKKIGVPRTSHKASDVPPPASGAMFGEVTFDYSAFNGRYVIGSGATEFETAWSKCSNTRIHLYNDPSSIDGIAIGRGANKFEQISDASVYDFTSRVRTVNRGEIAVLRNTNGFYAAVQILEIEDDRQGASNDALTIRYAILPNGEKDFAAWTGEATKASSNMRSGLSIS